MANLRLLVVQLFLTINHGKSLTVGSNGTDVWALQVFLSIDGAGPASTKLLAHGPTGYFGALTRDALAEFQKANGITPADGYFGTKTYSLISNFPESH